MANILGASRYKNVKFDLTTAVATTIYTCPALMTTFVSSMLVSNDTSSADTITVTITNGSSIFSLFKVKAVAANTSIELLSNELILVSGDILNFTAATADRLHVISSLVEVPKTTTA
jgi:hypothetical protein